MSLGHQEKNENVGPALNADELCCYVRSNCCLFYLELYLFLSWIVGYGIILTK